MKTIYIILGLLLIASPIFTSCGQSEQKKPPKKAVNYTVLLDLSDRVLTPNQLDKDITLITTFFKDFEQKARRNLIVTSKDCFSIKIIPQKGSPLNASHFEDALQLDLNNIEVQDKNKSLESLSRLMSNKLESLKKEATYSDKAKDYFGVDIWSYLHDNGKSLSKSGYENKILVLTDGYFDFENDTHVIQQKNRYTSTAFLETLTALDWQKKATENDYGLLPVKLDPNTQWVVAGITSKKVDDILQNEKLCFFWNKWLKESGATKSNLLLNVSKSNLNSSLKELL